jgi:hypothetical protein
MGVSLSVISEREEQAAHVLAGFSSDLKSFYADRLNMYEEPHLRLSDCHS